MVFVGGLHRSGTTIVARTLETHPSMDGLRDTGVAEDEGQHLQDVYPTARALGGPGSFAWSPAAHLTEDDAADPDVIAARLVDSWLPYALRQRPYLVEKSPPNLVRTRFLQAIFPDARFVLVMRHPGVVAMRTRPWRPDLSPVDLVDHWTEAHDLLAHDLPDVHRTFTVRYESFVADPETQLRHCADVIGVEPTFDVAGIEAGRSEQAFAEWLAVYESLPVSLAERLACDARRHGYRPDQLDPTGDVAHRLTTRSP
jgi:hypothetical protein